VSRIFLSHSSVNNAEAVALRDWLSEQGWDDIFLDLDPERGIVAGERWERALHEAASRCEAVLFLVSRAWLDSRWCQKELTLADKLNKRLFAVLTEPFEPAELPTDLSRTWQIVDLASGRDHQLFRVTLPRTHDESHVHFSAEGLTRLKAGLIKAGLDPRFFSWPPASEPDRAAYRGLRPLEAEDAGIFFGRDAPMIEALDQLRGMREAAPPRLLVILGASGAGKSSFVRAGLIARLARDERAFVPLPIIRPERAAISGDTGLLLSLQTALDAAGIGMARSALRTAINGGVDTLRPVLQALADKHTPKSGTGQSPYPPSTLVISIDQGEELFRSEGQQQAQQLLELLAGLLTTDTPALIVTIAIRSDSYAQLQEAGPLDGVGKTPFDLGPMPHGCYAEVITGPATRLQGTPRQLKIEPALVGALLADIETGGAKDALPLLSFTLERLYLENRGAASLTVADYQALGGIQGSIEEAVEHALEMAEGDPTIATDHTARLALLRRGLIPWLADIDPDTGAPRRRVARVSEIPPECRPLLQSLVEQRLLTTDTDAQTGETTIEPAHEALLRQWSLLQGWLADDHELLAVLEGIKRAARDWTQAGRSAAWLTHSAERLVAAEQLTQRPDLAARLDPTDHEYLATCRTADDERRAAEEHQRQAELRHAEERREAAEAHAAVLRRRSRILRAVLAGTAIVALVALIGFVQANRARHQATREARDALAAQLDTEASAVFSRGTAGGDDVRALAQTLAAQRLRSDPGASRGAFYTATTALNTTRVIVRTPTPITGVAVSRDGHTLASGSDDHTVWLWNLTDPAAHPTPLGQPLTGLTGVGGVAFSPDGHTLASGSRDETVRLWNLTDPAHPGPLGQPLTGHTNSVWSVAFSPDGRTLASGSADHTIRLWNLTDPAHPTPLGQPLTGHTNSVFSVAFSPDGRTLASGSADHTIRLWNLTDPAHPGPLGQPLAGHTNIVASVAFSPDGRTLASGGDDDTVRLWSLTDPAHPGPLGQPLTSPNLGVRSVAFSPDGHTLASANRDATIRLWNLTDPAHPGPLGQPLTGHTDTVASVAFSPDGRTLASGSRDATIRLWNLDAALPLQGHTDEVRSVAFSPDGHTLASGSRDDTVRLWNLTDPAHPTPLGQPLTGHTSWVLSVAFSPDGRTLASGSDDHTVRLWNLTDPAHPTPLGQPLTGHTNTVWSVAFSPDGHTVASGSADHTVRLWNLTDPAHPTPLGQPLTGHTGDVGGVAFSPDGHTLASSGGPDNTVRLWNLTDPAHPGPLGQPLTGHTNTVFSVAFSPDGHTVASGSADHTIRLWNLTDPAHPAPLGQPLTGHTNTVSSVAFSPDGHTLASGSWDDTIRLWNLTDPGHPAPLGQPLTGHTNWVFRVAFSPDGHTLASASGDDTVRLWPTPLDATVATLCSKLTSNISHQQWHDWISPTIGYLTLCPGLPVPQN
jgi:WD40 repeat protein